MIVVISPPRLLKNEEASAMKMDGVNKGGFGTLGKSECA